MRRLLAVLPLLAAAPALAQSYVVTNARVYTVDDARPRAQAFAVVDGRFGAVGTPPPCAALIPACPCTTSAARPSCRASSTRTAT